MFLKDVNTIEELLRREKYMEVNGIVMAEPSAEAFVDLIGEVQVIYRLPTGLWFRDLQEGEPVLVPMELFCDESVMETQINRLAVGSKFSAMVEIVAMAGVGEMFVREVWT